MVCNDNLTVCANFDSGDFMGTFSVTKRSNTYNSSDSCIQTQYNLSSDDFKVLELMILITVEKYLRAEGKINEN